MENENDSKEKNRRFMVLTRQCRQCGLPFTTTSSVEVVHAACRIEYYKTKARLYQNMKGRNRPDMRERKKYFINECACEACGSKELTRIKKFFHPSISGEQPITHPHILCPNCIMKFRIGLMEALTWKPLAV